MVKIRTRLLIMLVLFCGLGLHLLFRQLLGDVRPQSLQAMEESMVDMSVLLAAQVANQAAGGAIAVDDLRAAFTTAKRQTFNAQIYEMTKNQINLRVYVTDSKGIVLFDSDGGKDEGKDYSRWNDVRRTLQGKYGARASRTDPDDPLTSLICVAAPIKANGEIAGVLTVCKPTESVSLFFELAQRDIMVLGVTAMLALLVIALMISFWVTWPIEVLTRYVKAIQHGQRATPPRLGRSEIGALGIAFEEMRAALDGKQYVEEYVQSLTHQMKSPLSAIRGAAELLEEDMSPEQRCRFTENIRTESKRIQDIIDRMLRLSALENRRQLHEIKTVDIIKLLAVVIEEMRPIFSGKRLNVQLDDTAPANIACESFLIRQAVSNLLQNAADFSRNGGNILVSILLEQDYFTITILDEGYGIPEYARDKVLDRFYSLQRPDTGKKSSGLGLAFAKEVAALHGGRVTVENRPEGGVKAALSISLHRIGN